VETLIKIIGGAFAGVGLIFVLMLLGTVFGGIGGWVVGGMFPYVTDTIRSVIGVTLTDFQLGATLGFFGGFFRSYSSSS